MFKLYYFRHYGPAIEEHDDIEGAKASGRSILDNDMGFPVAITDEADNALCDVEGIVGRPVVIRPDPQEAVDKAKRIIAERGRRAEDRQDRKEKS